MLALEVFALQLAADLAPKILLALTVLTVVFGVGVVVFGRRRDARVDLARDDFARDDLAKVATEPDVG
ncbi:MAG: hypothetical protein EBQ54_04695, partial [Actinobacteria bacterium]|nr:hypothetical protein [Actinomycetota bacterium]